MKERMVIAVFFFCMCLIVPSKVALAATNMDVTTTKQPDNKVMVAWNSVEGAVKYNVQVSLGDESHYQTKATITVESVNAELLINDGEATNATTSTNVVDVERMKTTIRNISQVKTYYFKVVALKTDGTIVGNEITSLYNGNIVSTTKQKYSYKDMKTDIKQLQKKYSDYVHVDVIGKTVDNRNIYDVILGNPDAKKCVVFQASIHAREYMTTQLVMEQMEYYLDHYNHKYKDKTYKTIFNNVCVHVVAMSNPDGVTISQKGIKGIRNAALRNKLKKMYGADRTAIWKANARGVDLNRQFDYRFKYVKKYKKGAYALYGGRKPVSENESKALVQLVNKVNPKAVVNYHAMGNVIYCKYGASKKMQNKVYKLSSEIRSLTGYSYMGLNRDPGFANWLVCKKGIPSCTVEIGRHATPVPISQFKTIWQQNQDVMAAAARLYY